MSFDGTPEERMIGISSSRPGHRRASPLPPLTVEQARAELGASWTG